MPPPPPEVEAFGMVKPELAVGLFAFAVSHHTAEKNNELAFAGVMEPVDGWELPKFPVAVPVMDV